MTNQNKINSGQVISQKLTTSTSSVVTCNTAIPYDNSIPQSGEGDEVLTLSITPKSATSTLYIVFTSFVTNDTNANNIATALFQDSNANALAAQAGPCGASRSRTGALRHVMTSGTTSSTTFKIRVGPSANTCYVNGTNAGGALFNGVASTRLTITEYI